MRTAVTVVPKGPVVLAHPRLCEQRFLALEELGAFSVLVSNETHEPHSGNRPRLPILAAVEAGLDARRERVVSHQYLRLAVVRRDVRYEMCGTTGTLVLSGTELEGASSHEALAPIKRRRVYWILAWLALMIAAAVLAAPFRGAAAYFSGANARINLAYWAALFLAIPALGGLLRVIRPRGRLGPLAAVEKATGVCALAALVYIPLQGRVLGQPTPDAARATLAAGDLASARLIVDALKERSPQVPSTGELEDLVALAAAKTATGDARLSILDTVAARRGPGAAQGATEARAERLRLIGQALEQNNPDRARRALDAWFPGSSDSDILETRAKTSDVAFLLCRDLPCRLAEALSANKTATTPARQTRAQVVRKEFASALVMADIPGESPADRTRRLLAVAAAASGAAERAAFDGEVVSEANKAGDAVSAKIAATPLLGLPLPVVESILGGAPVQFDRAPCRLVDNKRVCISVDAKNLCRGLYVVGPGPAARRFNGSQWTPDRFLSQVVGRSTVLRAKPLPNANMVRSYEGGLPVVTRWNGAELVELRIGDAQP